MKKFKLGPSIFVLMSICLLSKNFLLITNYFIALFLHELAHLFVATKRGYSLNYVKLDMFGLAIDLNEKIDEKDQFAINIAGPVFNLFICLVCMAVYWLIPSSYFYLNTFCFSNLILAIFNLLPIYPLDGGKVFRGMIKSDKTYKLLDKTIRWSLAILFICAFIISCFKSANFVLLALAIFFLSSKPSKETTMSIFKFHQNKNFDKVVILKVNESEILFNLLKKINTRNYTIFYLPNQKKYFDENDIIELSLKYQLTTSLSEIK